MDFYEPSAKELDREMRDMRRRLLGALALILIVTVIGIVGFSIIDPDAGLIRAFYMTAITLTTVGYGEEIAVDTDPARMFTAVLILVGMGVTLYFVSTATAFLLEGQLGHVFRRRKMERDLSNLSGHLIVCGSGQTAVYAASELAAVERAVVLIVTTEEEVEEARERLPDIPIVLGDPTEDDILEAAGIARASGVIACSPSDNQNVVVTLTARQLNPDVRIVSRLSDVDNEIKIRKVGADSVVSPQHIGGLRLASELIRPAVVTFLDTMLRDRDRNLRVDEIRIPPGARSIGKKISEIQLRELPGILLLAIRDERGDWEYNPPRSSVIREGTTMIFLGSPEDSRQMRERLGGTLVANSAATL